MTLTTSDITALAFTFVLVCIFLYTMSRYWWVCPDCAGNGMILHAERWEFIDCPTCNSSGRKSGIWWL